MSFIESEQSEPVITAEYDWEMKNKAATLYLQIELENLTQKYEDDRNFEKTLAKLNKIAAEKKFQGVLIHDFCKANNIGVGGFVVASSNGENLLAELPRDYILIGENILDNIKNLFETDVEFAEEGFSLIFEHEAQHIRGKALEAYNKDKVEAEKIVKKTKDAGVAQEKIMERHVISYPKSEILAETQKISETYEDSKKFIKEEAVTSLTGFIVANGIEAIRQGTNFELNPNSLCYCFIKNSKISDIEKKVDIMGQKLLEKHDKKVKGIK